jgi:hypothetical protein
MLQLMKGVQIPEKDVMVSNYIRPIYNSNKNNGFCKYVAWDLSMFMYHLVNLPNTTKIVPEFLP